MTTNSMTVNSKTAILSDADLDLVSGGAALTPVDTPLQKAAKELSAIYIANHPIQLGPFPTPHVAVPH